MFDKVQIMTADIWQIVTLPKKLDNNWKELFERKVSLKKFGGDDGQRKICQGNALYPGNHRRSHYLDLP